MENSPEKLYFSEGNILFCVIQEIYPIALPDNPFKNPDAQYSYS